jgi:cell wall-associated NlpC family hydrolase
MVTQLLFGELFRILSLEKEWAHVEMSFDEYRGWVPFSQFEFLTEKEFLHLFNAESAITTELLQLLSNTTRQTIFPIVAGSSLPGFENGEFLIRGETYYYDGEVKETSSFENATTRAEIQRAKKEIVSDAIFYLNAPYLWGGRTPFGIDCSGFTQMVYKKSKIRLPRDSAQQALHGEPLSFLSEAEPGDLAFFDNEEGKIIHVGIIIDTAHIIHASGRVRIDTIDHQGIYNVESNQYTHTLRVIKRMV